LQKNLKEVQNLFKVTNIHPFLSSQLSPAARKHTVLIKQQYVFGNEHCLAYGNATHPVASFALKTTFFSVF